MEPKTSPARHLPDYSPARHGAGDTSPDLRVMDEVPDDIGVVLWLTLRDAQHWADTPPSRRAGLFVHGAASQRLAQLVRTPLPLEVDGPVTTLTSLLIHPASVAPRLVATACFRLAAVMEERGAPNAALLFARAGALAEPERTWRVLKMGRMPPGPRKEQSEEQWLACAAAVARRVEAWGTFAEARSELGRVLAAGLAEAVRPRRQHLTNPIPTGPRKTWPDDDPAGLQGHPTSITGPAPKELAVLRYLRDLALGGGGFEWEGVRGWATHNEIRKSLGFLPSDILKRLRTILGWVDAADVRWPNRPRSLWMFRLSDEGIRGLAAVEHAPHAPELPKRQTEASRGFYLRRRCLGALEVLREELNAPTGLEHVPGETGWLSGTELNTRVRDLPGFGWVHPEDTAILVAAGLVERRDVNHGTGGAMKPVYHITPAGLEAVPLTWREPD